MKKKDWFKTHQTVLVSMFLGWWLMACQTENRSVDWEKGEQLLRSGRFEALMSWTDSLKLISDSTRYEWIKADSLQQMMQRLEQEFPYDETAIQKQLQKRMGAYSKEEKQKWEEAGQLEFRLINGQKRYFKRAVANLLILQSDRVSGLIEEPLSRFCLSHTKQVLDQTKENGQLVLPRKFNVTYRITVKPDVVPHGETVRCWMPWPKENHPRQADVVFIDASESEYRIAPDSCMHRSVYMEKKAEKGQETVFEVHFSYLSQAQYFELSKANVLPYRKEDPFYKQYTSQQLPHITFTDGIRQLADSIVGETADPEETVRRLYYWIDENIPWAGALEYGVMPCIPAYVLEHQKGDCGMQTLLFMSMARYKGIPVRWQSGWMMHPGEENLHDWCEVFYEGVGWVPLDMTFNLQDTDNHRLREFYITGIDAFRLIVNDGIGAAFYPEKQHLRSEPWDFQRGEVEWRGGNLYFDQWSYQLIVNE